MYQLEGKQQRRGEMFVVRISVIVDYVIKWKRMNGYETGWIQLAEGRDQ
jgi:hypothetical protein